MPTDVLLLPFSQPPVETNILRITYLSCENKRRWFFGADNWTLTIRLMAYTDNTAHNFLVIRVNGQDYQTPYQFFGDSLLNQDEIRAVSLSVRRRSDGTFIKSGSSKNFIKGGWLTLERFEVSNFVVSIRDAGSSVDWHRVTELDFDTDGNLIGSVCGAPILPRKMTGLWADLKR